MTRLNAHRWLALLSVLSACLVGLPDQATASSIVLPGTNSAVEGNGAPAPNFFGANAFTLQTVVGTSLLGGLGVGDTILGLRFRLDGSLATGPASNVTWTDWSLTLSPSVNAPGSLSATFANNIGTGAVLVRTGSLTVPANSMPGGNSPNAFGFLIGFTTPYVYTGGNLLLTLSHSIGTGAVGVDYQFLSGVTDAENQGGPGSGALTSTFQQDAMPVIQLAVAPVPEPSTLLLLGTGFAMGVTRWRRSGQRSQEAG